MHRRLSLAAGTLSGLTVFLVFHALLAITAICSLVVLAPWVLLTRWADERKVSSLDGIDSGPGRI
jgi:hypothetical protein